MRSPRKLTGVTWLLVLLLLPWPVDHWRNLEQRRQYAREGELFEKYDCRPVTRCADDFNGDGVPARIEVVSCGGLKSCVVVFEAGREILRLKYDGTDGTLRTHAAVSGESGRSRLLVYDGVSQRPALRAAYAWDGARLAPVKPNGFEQEIIAAMAAHDDTGGWGDRAFSDLIRLARFAAYYLLLLVLTCVLWAGRFYTAKPGPARAPHFLCRRQSQ